MTRRAAEPADLGTLSGCAAELAEAFVSLASDIALVIDTDGVVRSVAQNATTPIAADASQWVGRPWAEMVNARSVGIKDLRHGAVAEEDWHGHDPDEPGDRQPDALR